MSFERMSNQEIENVLKVSSKNDLSPAARVLINELYQRVRSLEQQISESGAESR